MNGLVLVAVALAWCALSVVVSGVVARAISLTQHDHTRRDPSDGQNGSTR